MAGAWRLRLSAWVDFRFAVDRYREVDDERVLVFARMIARGRTSGLAFEQQGANLFHLRNGKVTQLVAYWEPDRALADLGLEE
jgi:ketosteroid isomerase-like protein